MLRRVFNGGSLAHRPPTTFSSGVGTPNGLPLRCSARFAAATPAGAAASTLRHQQRQMRRWFDAVVSLGVEPLQPMGTNSTLASLAAANAETLRFNQQQIPASDASLPTGAAAPANSASSPSSVPSDPWLRAVVDPMAKEARAILKALQNANALGADLPDSIISALWSVFDRLYLVRYRDLSLDDKLSLEARQYEYFLLMSQAGTDIVKVDDLAARVKAETEALVGKHAGTGGISPSPQTASSSSSSSARHHHHHHASLTTLVRLVEELRGASMPLFHRWLRQSAASGHIVSDAATVLLDSSNKMAGGGGGSSGSREVGGAVGQRRVVEYDLHERFGGRVRVGGALGLPGAHGMQKIIMLRAALLKAITRLEKRKKNGTLAEVAEFSSSSSAAADVSSTAGTTAAVAPRCLEEWYEERRTALEVLNAHCFSLLKQWMRHGEGIAMREVRWDDTAPSILEKVIAAEVVHPFAFPALSSLRHRLQPTARERHLFCFFHEGIGFDEPLIAVQVALTKGIANSVDSILGRPVANPSVLAPCCGTAKAAALQASSSGDQQLKAALASTPSPSPSASAPFDTAIFYSINSAQVGLKGVDLGNSLIKAAVKHLQTTHSSSSGGGGSGSRLTAGGNDNGPLRFFSTLSPIPMYTHWLRAEVRRITAALLASPDAPSLNIRKANNCAVGETVGDEMYSDAHLNALAEAVAVSGSRIFGPRVRKQYVPPSSSSSVDAQQHRPSAAACSGCGGPDAFASHMDIEPEAIVGKKLLRAWLGNISEAVRSHRALHEVFYSSANGNDGSAQPLNVLEALVDMIAPPPPPSAAASKRAESSSTSVAVVSIAADRKAPHQKPRKKDPIAAIHEIPKNFSVCTAASSSTAPPPPSQWWADKGVAALLERPLCHSISCYLACEKQRDGSQRILDPVGNFHVGNGAVLWRINWLANQSEKGSRESACCMVNYWYDLAGNASNARGYELAQTVPVGEPVRLLWAEGLRGE